MNLTTTRVPRPLAVFGPLCTFLGVAPTGSVSFDSGSWTNVPPAASTDVLVSNP